MVQLKYWYSEVLILRKTVDYQSNTDTDIGLAHEKLSNKVDREVDLMMTCFKVDRTKIGNLFE